VDSDRDGDLDGIDGDAESEPVDDHGSGRGEIRGVDRRSLRDRRRAYDLNYFASDGVERRKWKERRRRRVEPRRGWIRISDWTSAMVGSGLRPDELKKVYKIDDGD